MYSHSHAHHGHAARSRSNTVIYAVVLGCCAIFISYQALSHLVPRMVATGFTEQQYAILPTFSIDCSNLTGMAKAYAWKNVTVSENGVAKFTMSVYNSSDIVSDHISRGTWEEAEVRQVEWALHRYALNDTLPRPVFIDIGANVGWFTLVMALRNYTVYAFEGMAQNARMISSSLCANPHLASRVHLHLTGLGPAPNRCWIFSGDINVGDGHTMCGIPTEAEARSRVPAQYSLRGDMNITRLDDVLLPKIAPSPTSTVPPLVLKIDVEGFEYEVLKGATQLLSRGFFHYILAEWAPFMMGPVSGPTAPRDILYLLTGLGFAVSNKGFAGPFLPPNRLGDLAANWKEGQQNLYLVHRNAPTYSTITYMTPAEAGLEPPPPTPAAVQVATGSPGAGSPAVSAAVAAGMEQLQQPMVGKAPPVAAQDVAAAANAASGAAQRQEKRRRLLQLRRLARED